MRKFTRGDEPDFLADNWESWGRDWEQQQLQGKTFYWHQIAGEPVNQKLMPLLKLQTQDHCSFCDNFPVSPPSIDTIEHFRPKSRFPLDAFRWTNLYFCCVHCQQKNNNFDEAALQPDTTDYQFDRYFRWDYTRGTIEPNEQATAEDQKRAAATIQLYNLNERHPALRKLWMTRRPKLLDEPLDSLPYRHYIG